jgi:hypothetical protein
MNIILENQIHLIPDSFTKLQLDTFRDLTNGHTVSAWCVIENLPLHEFATLDAHTQLHQELIVQYKKRNWDFCVSAIDSLMGRWNGELNSFYHDLLTRVNHYQSAPPEQDWDGSIPRRLM